MTLTLVLMLAQPLLDTGELPGPAEVRHCLNYEILRRIHVHHVNPYLGRASLCEYTIFV